LGLGLGLGILVGFHLWSCITAGRGGIV